MDISEHEESSRKDENYEQPVNEDSSNSDYEMAAPLTQSEGVQKLPREAEEQYPEGGAGNIYEQITPDEQPSTRSQIDQRQTRNFIEEMKVMNLQGRALAHAENNEYSEAKKYFRRIESLKPNESSEIYNMIILTECNMMCGDSDLTNSNINYIIQLMHSQQIHERDVEKLGVIYKGEKLYIRAFIAHHVAAKLCHSTMSDSLSAAAFIVSQINQITDLVEKAVLGKCGYIHRMTMENIIPFLKSLVNDMKIISVENHRDIVLWRSECLFYISLCYAHCEEYNKSIDELVSVVNFMMKELEEKCENFRLYGGCIKFSASLHAQLGRKETAIEKFNAAIQALQKATDWTNDDEKNKAVTDARESLWALENDSKKNQSTSQKIGSWWNRKVTSFKVSHLGYLPR